MAQGYHDPVLTKLIAVLNAQGPASLKNRYYQGDPVVVPNKSALPVCFISRDKTMIKDSTVSEDESRMPIVINVVYDLTRDIGQAFDNINSANAVYEFMEARNSDYTLRADSIAYVMRDNYQLDEKLYINFDQKPIEIDYGVGVNKRGNGIFTVEGVMRIELYHYQLLPGVA